MKRRIGGAVVLALASLALRAAHAQDVDASAIEDVAPNAPPESAHLLYHLRQTVRDGSGEYEGWGDSLVSVGTYTTHGNQIHASYRWQYASPDRVDHGTVTRDVSFDVATRVYDGETDLDDYDHVHGRLTTWLWIDTSMPAGTHVQILDDELVVVGEEDVDVAGDRRHAIHVRGDEHGHRDDEYGNYTTHATDDYWFDAATGMFLRETRVESDDGRYHGEPAGFEMELEVEVVDASYAPALGPLPDDPEPDTFAAVASQDDDDSAGLFFAILVGAVVVFFAIAAIAARAARNPYRDPPYRVERVGSSDPLPSEVEGLSPHLGVFLPHMTAVARRSGNAVGLARAKKDGAVSGLSIDDADARIVAIYANDADCAERLRVAAMRSELISEKRYGPLPTVTAALTQTNSARSAGAYAYNLYETFEVMERRGPIDPPEYDPTVVVRMKREDLPAAAAIAQKVYAVPCLGFLEASLAEGDVAFVAKEDGKIVGLALATVAGTAARLHTLVVDPDAQSRGLGKELYRARLRALADLGVDRVVTEVAANNHAAIEIARAFGMTKVGEMHVQSARSTRDAISVVRR